MAEIPQNNSFNLTRVQSLFTASTNLTPLQNQLTLLNTTQPSSIVAFSSLQSGATIETASAVNNNARVSERTGDVSVPYSKSDINSASGAETVYGSGVTTDLNNGNTVKGTIENALKRLREGGGGGFYYPEDIINAKYSMLLQFAEYTRQDAFSVSEPSLLGPVFLPLPENLLESYTVNYDTTDLGAIFGASIDFSPNARPYMQQVMENTGTIAAHLGSGALNKAGLNGLAERLGQDFKTIVNPHSSIIFKGMQLRTHTLSWKFSPKNSNETFLLQNVIQYLRVSTLPANSGLENGGFLSYPDIVWPILLRDGNINPYLFPFKWCSIRNMTVTYTPDGGSAFYKNGAPVAVLLTLELQELEIILRDDFNMAVNRNATPVEGLIDWITNQLPDGTRIVQDPNTGTTYYAGEDGRPLVDGNGNLRIFGQ
jgi:hypothetical protein